MVRTKSNLKEQEDLLKSMLIKTVKRPENVITRQFEILKMLKQDSLCFRNYDIIRA